MGMIKDRNEKDLTEAEEIMKRWQEHAEELYKKILNDLDNHCSVFTHLEPDILQCEVKWASGNIRSIIDRHIIYTYMYIHIYDMYLIQKAWAYPHTCETTATNKLCCFKNSFCLLTI